jgi:hypothetical protein
MKLQINKTLRFTLLTINILALIIVSGLIYWQYQVPHFKEENLILYSYKQTPNINYRVFLKPNILYESNNLEEGQLYITEFVDYVRMYFSYEFNGEREASIQGDYTVSAFVEGYTMQEKQEKTLWKKGFTLIPITRFEAKNQEITVSKEIPLRIEAYNNFAAQVIEASKIGSSVRLSVVMDVNVQADTDKGVVEEKSSSSIVIPLNVSSFEIGKNGIGEKSGAIEENKQVQLPVEKSIIIIYGVILGILAMILLYLIFFTTVAPERDPLEKALKKIFKNHGNRLVALNGEIVPSGENINRVKSIDDLVRIADEVGKPILYQYHSDFRDMTCFYVYDDKIMYLLDVAECMRKEEKSVVGKMKEKTHEDVEVDSAVD